MKLNSSKTHFMCIWSPQKRGGGVLKEVKMGQSLVEESEKERILGVQVSNRLQNWNPQVQKILQSCSVKLNGLKAGGKHFPFKVKLETAKAVHSGTMFYGAECWGPGLSKAQIRSLQASQNKMLRWVVGCRAREMRSKDLLKETGELSVNQTIALKVLRRGLSVLRTEKPINTYKTLMKTEITEERSLRSSSNPMKVKREGSYRNKHWKNAFLELFKKLPEEVKNANMKKAGGKKKLKSWIKANVEKYVD